MKNFISLLLIASCLSMTTCLSLGKRTAQDSKPDKDYAHERPSVLDRETLTVAFSGDSLEFDFRKSYLASEAQFYTSLYEGLFSYHPLTMEPVLAVCDKWELSKDKKEWTFRIRSNARYWNGDTVKAEDFRAAWLSVIDPEANSPYSSLFDIIEGAQEYRLGHLTDKNKVGITAIDNKTLQVRLNAPAAFFPSMLCHHAFSPIHPSMLTVKDWSKAPPISNGPFFLLKNEGTTKVLARNELYWGASDVEIKNLIVKYPNDPQESAALWNSGECRWVTGDIDLNELTDVSSIVVNAMFATHYYYICSTRKPWNDPKVRRALMLALPWNDIRKEYRLPAKTLIYPIQGYPEIKGVSETDVDEAKKLLAEAGFPDGKGLPSLVLRLNPSQESARIGGIMSNTWMKSLGVPVKIQVAPFSEYFDSLKKDDYDVGASTWIGDFADPYSFLEMWRRDSNLNDAHNNDVDFEKLIDRSMLEDGDQRWATLGEAEEILLGHGTVLPISYSFAVNIIDVSEIDGWYPNVLDIHPLKYLSFKDFKPLPGVVRAK